MNWDDTHGRGEEKGERKKEKRKKAATHRFQRHISLSSPLSGQPAIYFLILVPWPHPAQTSPAKESQCFSLTNGVDSSFRSHPERN